MANLRRGSFQRTRGSSRRLTIWNAGPESSALQSITAAGNTIVDTGFEFVDVDTIVRLRGELAMFLSAVVTIGDGFTRYDAGVGLVSADAFGVGVTAMPSPSLDKDWGGWLWHHSGGMIVGQETTELARGPMSAIRIPIDSKAMRKVSPNQVIFGAVSTVAEVGAVTLVFSMGTRMLIKAH